MISRRQIIENQQELRVGRDARNQLASSGSGSGLNNNTNRQTAEASSKRKPSAPVKQQAKNSYKTFEHEQNQDFNLDLAEEMAGLTELKCFQEHKQYAADRSGARQTCKHQLGEQQHEHEDESLSDEREDECMMMMMRNKINCNQHHEDYRHFDPYSVYGEEDEEEDVWYSEERLFEVSDRFVMSA